MTDSLVGPLQNSSTPLPSVTDDIEMKEIHVEMDDSKQSSNLFDDEERILPLPESSTSLILQQNNVSNNDCTEMEFTLDLDLVFIVEKSIGRGKTAHVHYAIYKDLVDIALKEFRFGRLTQKILLQFHQELETLKKLDHENICRLLGHFLDVESKQLYLGFE